LLSGGWVHFAVLPPSGGLRSADERAQLAHHVFRRQYGALANDWQLLSSPGPAKEPTLACAVAGPVIDALRQRLGELGKVTSIRPYLMDTFNRIRHSVGQQPDACDSIAMVEAGYLTLASIRQTQWTNVIGHHTDPKNRSVLTHTLWEQSALGTLPSSGVLWVDDPENCADQPLDTGWTFRSIPAAGH
jgi:hypothetical protein